MILMFVDSMPELNNENDIFIEKITVRNSIRIEKKNVAISMVYV